MSWEAAELVVHGLNVLAQDLKWCMALLAAAVVFILFFCTALVCRRLDRLAGILENRRSVSPSRAQDAE